MDTLFFIASKLGWAAIRPDTLLMVAVAASWLWAGRWPKVSRALAGGVVLAMASIALFPVQNLALRPLESAYPLPEALPAGIDGIIVLGGAELTDRITAGDRPQLNDAAERMTEAMTLARQFPDAKLVFTGGSGRLTGGPAGAMVAERLLIGLGLPPDRLVLEGRSRNTAENARFTYDLVRPEVGQRWLLVTSAFHMRRSVESFCAAGWTGITPWPVDFRVLPGGADWRFVENLFDVTLAIREWVGIAAYRLTGRAVAPDGACLAAQ